MAFKNILMNRILNVILLYFWAQRIHLMKTKIICPTCKSSFHLEDILTEDVEREIKAQYEAENQERAEAFAARTLALEAEKAAFEEKKKRENELFMERVAKETEARAKHLEVEITKKMTEASQARLDFLEKENKEKDNRLKELQSKELEVMQLNRQLEDQREQEAHKLLKQRFEIETELKEKLSVEVLSKEREKHELEKRELEKQLSDQKKLTEQMTRKLEQGSMQTQGEVQELALEELLIHSFPFDLITEVSKGKRGADCLLVVRNERGQDCGKIIFESKRTKNFEKGWLPKLKEDALEAAADISVLVSQVLPDDMRMFDQREGVWICKFNEVVQLVRALREGILNVARARQSQENKGEKKEMLYNYFTSNEFLQQMHAINEAYLYLKSSIDRERLQMEKIWKEREKQIDKVLMNNTYLLGTIKGIAGNDIQDDNLLD